MHPSDDPLLSYLVDDGLSIEPEWYVPVLPLVLINGADGIGTGKWCITCFRLHILSVYDRLEYVAPKLQPCRYY